MRDWKLITSIFVFVHSVASGFTLILIVFMPREASTELADKIFFLTVCFIMAFNMLNVLMWKEGKEFSVFLTTSAYFCSLINVILILFTTSQFITTWIQEWVTIYLPNIVQGLWTVYIFIDWARVDTSIQYFYNLITEIDDVCSICLEKQDGDAIIELVCKHQYHKDCIDKWFMNKENKTCPTCRQNADSLEPFEEEV